MSTGSPIRALARLLDASQAAVWAIGPDGKLVYLSAGVCQWLDVSPDQLLGRRCVAGAAVSTDPLDQLAASISPPPGLDDRGTASLKVQPVAGGRTRPVARETRFTRIGAGSGALVIAVAGDFADRDRDAELGDAVAIRQRLDSWRATHAGLTIRATAGTSHAARMLRRRLQVASATRADIGFFGPAGCAAESMASKVHELSAPGEPITVVDGPLMDAELLDATLMPLTGHLADSPSAVGTALVRSLDEMPVEAQDRLVERHQTYDGRLRLLGLCRSSANVFEPNLFDQSDVRTPAEPILLGQPAPHGITAAIAEILSSLAVSIPPLTARVDDIAMLATAMLDARRAAGETRAERISRAALDALVIYPWPGDFGELDAAVRHAARSATGQSIAPEELPLVVRSYRPGGQPSRPKSPPISLDEAVRRYELKLIEKAIRDAGGNRAEAARQLEISRARLLRKLDDA